MDFLILRNRGEGVVTHLTQALAQVGESFHFRPDYSGNVGLDAAIANKKLKNPDQPIHIVIDIEDSDIGAWDMPILSMLSTRVIAGQELPVGSSFVVVTTASKDDVNASFSSATVAHLVNIDLQTRTAERNPATHEATMQTLAQTIDHSSKHVLAQAKSSLVKLKNPDAVDIKMAERSTFIDLATYPTNM